MVAVVAPAASAPGRLAPGPSWWRYVERGHTHEVLAEWRSADGVVQLRETSPLDPDARHVELLRVARPWEARVALWQLQCRLGALGSYWQQGSADTRWRALVLPTGAPSPDHRRNLVIDLAQAPLVHHYHDAHGGGDHLIAALRVEPRRFAVLRAQLDVPSLDIGRIDVIHPGTPDVISRSLVMREQLALTQAGLGKLVNREDYERSFGYGGGNRAARLIDEVVARVRDGQLERPQARLEDSDVYAEFLVTVNDPRLRALHARFLAPGEEDTLLAGGPVVIRKAVAAKRGAAEHNAQHLLTILEASLLARERMKSGRLVRTDPEVRALTRLAYYL